MQTKNKSLLFLFVVFSIFSLPFISRYLYNWDTGQFALGLENYSLLEHQPHPPGYPVFIFLGKILNFIFSNANLSLTLISLFFGFLTVVFLFLSIKKVEIAIISALFLIFNPIFWFYREIALTYTVDCFVAIFLIYCLLKIKKNNNYKLVYLASFVLGLAGGFRPTLLVLLFPLYFLSFIYLKNNRIKQIILNFLILGATILIWLIPMVYLTGGLKEYLDITNNLFGASAKSTTNKAEQFKTFGGIFLMLINVLLVPLLISLYLFFKEKIYHNIFKNYIFWIIILGVSPAFFVYGIAHFGQPGYALIFLPFIIILSLKGISFLYKTKLGKIIIICLLLVESFCFLGLNNKVASPVTYPETNFIEKKLSRFNTWFFKFNYFMIKNNDEKLSRTIDGIKQNNPDETLIIIGRNLMYTADNGLLVRNDETFRQIMYYLPEYEIYEVAKYRQFAIKGNDYNSETIFFIEDSVMNYDENGNTILDPKILKINSQYKKAIILAQGLDKNDFPSKMLLQKKASFFEVDINDINQFEFLDFSFSKESESPDEL